MMCMLVVVLWLILCYVIVVCQVIFICYVRAGWGNREAASWCVKFLVEFCDCCVHLLCDC